MNLDRYPLDVSSLLVSTEEAGAMKGYDPAELDRREQGLIKHSIDGDRSPFATDVRLFGALAGGTASAWREAKVRLAGWHSDHYCNAMAAYWQAVADAFEREQHNA
jgi:hypothetical protein